MTIQGMILCQFHVPIARKLTSVYIPGCLNQYSFFCHAHVQWRFSPDFPDKPSFQSFIFPSAISCGRKKPANSCREKNKQSINAAFKGVPPSSLCEKIQFLRYFVKFCDKKYEKLP